MLFPSTDIYPVSLASLPGVLQFPITITASSTCHGRGEMVHSQQD